MTAHPADHWLAASDAELEEVLLGDLRRHGVKFASADAFRKSGWAGLPAPRIEPFWKHTPTGPVPSTDPYLWDLREALLHEQGAWLNAILLWRRLRRYGVEYVGGMETSAIPISASILAVNRVMHGPPLKAFYLRKERKKDGLRRVLEGPRVPPGSRIVAVDDLLNKGISKKALVDYCAKNELKLAALLVTIDTERKGGRRLFEGVCPVEALFTSGQILGRGEQRAPGRVTTPPPAAGASGIDRSLPPPPATMRVEVVERATAPAALVTKEDRAVPSDQAREDAELVRLARDTVIFTALGGRERPTLNDDGRGSAGWKAFLGRYLEERGPVFTRISKREFKNGRWFNRMRGCQCVGLMDPNPGTFAEMTIKSALVTATKARKVKAGAPKFHKPVWAAELGSLSTFVFVVEELRPTDARSADELREEGQDPRGWGLIGIGDKHRGVICADLDDIPSVEHQVRAVAGKMQNAEGILRHDPGALRFVRMRGRWLEDPSRPRKLYF